MWNLSSQQHHQEAVLSFPAVPQTSHVGVCLIGSAWARACCQPAVLTSSGPPEVMVIIRRLWHKHRDAWLSLVHHLATMQHAAVPGELRNRQDLIKLVWQPWCYSVTPHWGPPEACQDLMADGPSSVTTNPSASSNGNWGISRSWKSLNMPQPVVVSWHVLLIIYPLSLSEYSTTFVKSLVQREHFLMTFCPSLKNHWNVGLQLVRAGSHAS